MYLSLYWVAIYIIILFALSIFVVKKALDSFSQYAYCGRSLSIGYIMMTYLGTWIGGGTIIGLVSSSYESGASQYWVIALSCFVECIFAFFILEKIRQLNIKSITDFFADRFKEYNEIIRIPVVLGLIIRNVTMVGMQFSALAYLLTFMLGLDRNLSLLLVFFAIAAYTVLSGLWGVVLTDVFQGILQTLGLLVLVYLTFKMSGGFETVTDFYSSINKSEYLNFIATNLSLGEIALYIIAFGTFFLMNDQANWERIYASKNDATAKWGFIVPLIITLMMLTLITYIGVFQRPIAGDVTESQYVMYNFLLLIANSKITIFILVALIAAIMSSADSYLLSTGVLVSEDIIKKFINRNANDKEMIFWARVFIIVSGAIGFAFAINIEGVLFLWLAGIGMTSVLLIPGYLFCWFSKGIRTISILMGMTVGMVYVCVMAFGLIGYGAFEICIGMGLNLFGIILCELFFRFKYREEISILK